MSDFSEPAASRAEFIAAMNRLDDRMALNRDEVLDAVRDLKLSMNGQFSTHGNTLSRHSDVLGKHGADIAVLRDRGSRDNTARWGAVASALAAALAALLGWKN